MRRIDVPCSPRDLFRTITDTVLSLTGRRFWVEKTPHHMMHLDRILEHLPESRFVVMVRDPAAFLQSYKQQGDRKPPEFRRRFHRLYHPAVACTVTKRTYEAAQHASRREGVLLVKLEVLVADPETWLLRGRQHLGLPVSTASSFTQDNSSFADGAVEQRPLSSAERAWLRTLAGPPAAALGYDVDLLGGSRFALALSGSTLPWWALSNLRTLAKIDQGGLSSLVKRWLG